MTGEKSLSGDPSEGERGSWKELGAGPGGLQCHSPSFRVLQRAPELGYHGGEGGKRCSGQVFGVLHETLGARRIREPHLSDFPLRSCGVGCLPGARSGLFPLSLLEKQTG